MATMTSRTREPVVPTAHEAAIAREASRLLAPFVDHLETIRFQVGEEKKAARRGLGNSCDFMNHLPAKVPQM